MRACAHKHTVMNSQSFNHLCAFTDEHVFVDERVFTNKRFFFVDERVFTDERVSSTGTNKRNTSPLSILS